MVPRSRLVVLGTIASVMLVLGCKTETPTTTNIEDNGRITKPSKAPSKGGAFRGTVNFGGALAPDKATVTLVDEKLNVLTFVAKVKPDSAGKFTIKPAPTEVFFVLAEGGKSRLLGAVLPVDSKDPKEEPEIVVNAASTLTVAGIMNAFNRDLGGQHELEDLPIPLFNKLVEAVAATNPQLDLTKEPKDHAAQFGDLLKSNAGVKTAYDALFGELEARFKERNPGLPVPSPSVATTGGAASPSPLASVGTGLASVAPSPSPSVDPNASASPIASMSPNPTSSLSPSPGAGESPAPSPTPRTFPVLKHTMTQVSTTGDGATLTFGTDFNLQPCQLAFSTPVTATLMLFPDDNRLVAVDSISGQARALTNAQLLRPADAPPSLEDVAGVTTDGSNKIFAVGRVAGAPSLIVINVSNAFSGPAFDANSAVPLTGDDLPTGFGAQAYHNGFIYLASPEQSRVYKINSVTGATVRYAGDVTAAVPFAGQQDPATTNLNRPSGLAVIGDSLYCSEEVYHRIVKFNLAEGGKVEVLAGSATQFSLTSGTLADARFQRPSGLYYDADSKKIIVADTTNGTIRELNPDADPAKSQVLHYATVDSSGGNEDPRPLRFFLGAGKVGNDTYAVDQNGKLQKLTPKP